MNRIMKICLPILFVFAWDAQSYENQCSNVFKNGLESHTAGRIKFGTYSSMLGGQSSVNAGEISAFLNTSTCGPDIKCQATGLPSEKFPAFAPYSDWSTSIWGHQSYPEVLVGFNDTETYTANGVVRLEDLALLAFARLELHPGDYWVDNLYVGMYAELALAAPGQVRIFAREVDIKSFGKLGDESFPFIIYSGYAEYSTGSKVHAFHYSEKNIDVDSYVEVHGAIAADNIDLDIDSQVYFEPDRLADLNFGSICDYDNDGIYDGVDEDSDNDGISDELELEAGTDIYNADSVPTDTDGDGVIDIIDDDIDNDGYPNQDELDAGSDPYDPESVPLILSIGQQAGEVVYTNRYILTGLVSAGELNRIQLSVTTNGQVLAPSISGSGYFTQELILERGSNLITVTAIDDLGNRVEQSLDVTFTAPFRIETVTPTSGSQVKGLEQALSITVIVEDGLAPVVKVNGNISNQSMVSDGVYLSQANVSLLPGDNTISIEAVSGSWSVIESVELRAEPEDAENYPAPVISKFQPLTGIRTASQQVSVYAEIQSEVGRLTASINSLPVNVSQQGTNSYFVAASHPLIPGDNVIRVEVIDALGQLAYNNVLVHRDNQAPGIELTSPWLLPPEINEVPSPSITIEGKVLGSDVKSLKVSGQTIELNEAPGGYSFSQQLVVAPLTETYLELVATDTLGNKQVLPLAFWAATALELEWLTPGFPIVSYAQEGTGSPFAVEIKGATGSETYSAVLNPGGLEVGLTEVGQNVLTGSIPPSLVKGDYELVVTGRSGAYEAQLRGTISVLDFADTPLAISSTEPVLNGAGYEPDSALVVNFNRPVDPDAITFDVKRTLHGKTYVNKDKPGIEFFNARGAVLDEVHVSREQVEGGLSWIEGNRTVIFYPKGDLGYNADVYWNILEGDEMVGRFFFKTRTLPTFIDGGVKDSLGQSRSGVTVEIKELGKLAVTNSDGAFSFGYRSPASENIEEGNYTLVVNPDRIIPELGEIEVPISITGGKRNSLPLLSVPNIDLSIPLAGYQHGASELWLASGDIKLGLESTGLLFPDNSKALHTQFIPVDANVRPVDSDLAIFWLYQTQPFGISPVDPVEITINLPKYRGAYSYLLGGEDSEYWVLMVAYNPDKNLIEPVGIGSISGTILRSHGALDLPTLDYLGYATALPSHQEFFEQYLAGAMSFQELVFRVKTERPE